MGRGLITENQGEGLYTVEVDYGTTEVNQRIASLQAESSALDTAIEDLDDEIAEAEAERASAQSSLNAAISALNAADPDDDAAQKKAVDELTQKLYRALAAKGLLENKRSRAVVRKSNIQEKVETLQGLTLVESKSAWCCDYTEDATGQVATVEINGEQPKLLVFPGAPTPDSGGGLMTHRLAMSPSATFVNWAVLPGWQKFSPTYRVGELTAIDEENDLADVRLDDAASSAQELDINQAQNLSDVPIEYMTCNAQVFEVGDRVVVRFDNQDWEQPKVIGFESNPRQCEIPVWIIASYFTTDNVLRFALQAVSQDLQSVIETWTWTANLAVQIFQLSAVDTSTVWAPYPQSVAFDGFDLLVNAKTGQTEIALPVGTLAFGLAVSRANNRVYVSRQTAIESYSYDAGALVNTVSIGEPEDVERRLSTYMGASGDVVGAQFEFRNNGVSPIKREVYVSRLDKDSLGALWDTEVATEAPGTVNSFISKGLAVGRNHAVSLTRSDLVFGEFYYTFTVLDVSDGSIVREVTYFDEFGLRFEGLAIRGSYVYFHGEIAEDRSEVRIYRYNYLTGSPVDPETVSVPLFEDQIGQNVAEPGVRVWSIG